MKKLLYYLLVSLFIITSCNNDDDAPLQPQGPGEFEIEFDNIARIDGTVRQLRLADIGDENYDYENGMGQPFNITLLRYFITKIKLEGPNGEAYEDQMSASVSDTKGYYLVDEADPNSQFITLKDVPAGKYNKVTFTVGVDEDGVMEGAAGGVLDPATNNMFWNWNAGYIAVKFEGQSSVSLGGANGETIKPENANGAVYHVGGWKDVEGTGFTYNNKALTYEFDVDVTAGVGKKPHVHMFFDVLKMLDSKNTIDFTGNNNVHKPVDGTSVAENLIDAFAFDHVHE